jgi:hypothetical protein
MPSILLTRSSKSLLCCVNFFSIESISRSSKYLHVISSLLSSDLMFFRPPEHGNKFLQRNYSCEYVTRTSHSEAFRASPSAGGLSPYRFIDYYKVSRYTSQALSLWSQPYNTAKPARCYNSFPQVQSDSCKTCNYGSGCSHYRTLSR